MIKPALTFLGLVCGLTLAAQTVPAPAAPRMFRFIGLDGDFADLEMATGRQDSVKVAITAKSLSAVYPCPVSGEIVLFRWITDTDARGQPRKTQKRMAVIAPPPGREPFLVLLKETRDPANPYPLRGIPLDDSYKTYPAETIRIINLTKQRLAVKMEDKAAQIPMNGFDFFPLPASFKMCPLQIAYDKAGTWELAYDGAQGIKRKQRAIALVCDNPNPPNEMIGPLLVDVIKDRVPTATQGATALR